MLVCAKVLHFPKCLGQCAAGHLASHAHMAPPVVVHACAPHTAASRMQHQPMLPTTHLWRICSCFACCPTETVMENHNTRDPLGLLTELVVAASTRVHCLLLPKCAAMSHARPITSCTVPVLSATHATRQHRAAASGNRALHPYTQRTPARPIATDICLQSAWGRRSAPQEWSGCMERCGGEGNANGDGPQQ
jgi:hypothetical protein